MGITDELFTYMPSGVLKVVSGTVNSGSKKRLTKEIIIETENKYNNQVYLLDFINKNIENKRKELKALKQEIEKEDFIRIKNLRLCALGNKKIDLNSKKQINISSVANKSVENAELIQSSDIVKGVGAGLTLTAAAYTGVSTLGTASTGAAISGLAGAAGLNATLAALGGGSVAAGGLGMIGGAIFLGGCLAIPAISITGIKYVANIEKNYKAALKFQEEKSVEIEKLKLQICDISLADEYCTKLYYEIQNSRKFLCKILNVFECGLIDTRIANTANLLVESLVSLIKELFSITIIKEDQSVNKNFDATLSGIHNEIVILQQKAGGELYGFNNDVVNTVLNTEKIEEYITKPLANIEIKEQFYKIFSEAEKSICIMSPWITEHVITKIREHMGNALRRGVHIYILYGFGDNNSNNKFSIKNREEESDRQVKRLEDLFGRYKNFLHIKRHNSHGKIAICDDKYYLIGSYNFLSFSGDYDKNENLGGEICEYVENKKMLKMYKDMYFDFEKEEGVTGV